MSQTRKCIIFSTLKKYVSNFIILCSIASIYHYEFSNKCMSHLQAKCGYSVSALMFSSNIIWYVYANYWRDKLKI